MDMSLWASWLEDHVPHAPEDWVPSLPTRAEWVRAARGADGRPYPWGWEFDGSQCANYVWGPHHGRDAAPVPVGFVPADRSPFGVFDMAGSAAEITQDLHEPRPGEYVACGGSYWCDDPDDFRVTAMREDENGLGPLIARICDRSETAERSHATSCRADAGEPASTSSRARGD